MVVVFFVGLGVLVWGRYLRMLIIFKRYVYFRFYGVIVDIVKLILSFNRCLDFIIVVFGFRIVIGFFLFFLEVLDFCF